MTKWLFLILISSSANATGPGQIGVTVLNACKNNTIDPICHDLSLGRQYVDLTYRHYLMSFMKEPEAVVAVTITEAVVQRRLTVVISRDKKIGAPELTVRPNELSAILHWGF